MIYSELNVFKLSHQFVLDIYAITNTFPHEEKYRLVDQLIRASYSIPSNIAEGNSKNTTKDYMNFLYIARGSANEIKYFLLLAKDLHYLNPTDYQQLNDKITSIIKMLNALISSLKKKV